MFKKLRNKGFSLVNGPQGKKGFSLVELIVVIAIIGILVMLATPRFLGYVERAELKRIQHDVKVMEGKMEEGMVHNTDEFKSWDDNIKNLNALVAARQLFDTEGIARKVDKLSSLRFGRTASLEGVPSMVSEKVDGYRSYKVIPTSMKKNIKSSLPGTFYSNINGKVYYEHNKPLKGAEEEITLRCEAPEPIDYIFEHETGTIVKYTGNLQHLVIPSAFLVNGECWPVLIIGEGAFRRGTGQRPIITVILPPSLKEIGGKGFEGGELQDVEIPPSVTTIGPGAFEGNKIKEKGTGGGVVIKNKPGDVTIGPGAFDKNGPKGDKEVEPTFEPPTDKDLDIDVTIKKGKDGKPEGTINTYNGGGTSVTIPPTVYIGGKGVPIVEIEEGAFQGKGLITVGLPEGLLRIEDYAFEGNQLIAVNTPHSLQHIGNYAFAYNEATYKGKYKATIRTITIPTKEQINNLDKKGDIVSGGVKVPKLKDAVLLDHIFADSNSGLTIDTGNGNNGEGEGEGNGDKDDKEPEIPEVDEDKEEPEFDNETTTSDSVFIIPVSGVYEFEVIGGHGGGNSEHSDKNNHHQVKANGYFNKGEELSFIVGEGGEHGRANVSTNHGIINDGGGGGGGSSAVLINGELLIEAKGSSGAPGTRNPLASLSGAGGKGYNNGGSYAPRGGAGGGSSYVNSSRLTKESINNASQRGKITITLKSLSDK